MLRWYMILVLVLGISGLAGCGGAGDNVALGLFGGNAIVNQSQAEDSGVTGAQAAEIDDEGLQSGNPEPEAETPPETSDEE